MPIALTADVGFHVGPVVFDTLVKHYFDRWKKNGSKLPGSHKHDELLYDEAFNVVKEFLRISSFHTVEDVQGFSNSRTPSPPWVHVVRLRVPAFSCDKAATHLITAFGGEDAARRVVGGVRWWQVRGVNGVDAEWITARKDWKEAKHKPKQEESPYLPGSKQEALKAYEPNMDAMRCILYLHGGGYYFGSIDQERYSIQRHARKVNGRVFAVNYRLAPQYPFPCALQDVLAGYLFLIQPPAGSAHRPVHPSHIVIAGDSAGGGLSLALLQVIRDTGLPMPAGGVLISPWCDLTHSFPSIHINGEKDILPPWGLSFHKPSALWPPPSEEVSRRFHTSLRTRFREAFGMEEKSCTVTTAMLADCQSSSMMKGEAISGGPTAAVPVQDQRNDQTISFSTPSGEILTVDRQLHFYAQNSLLSHPLVSPALSYLGGLPPLFIVAGDVEVLRDEIIYMAHKASCPNSYPVTEEARTLYPSLYGIEERHKSTNVHLQVYDEAPHVLPVLFPFSTQAKYCFRAIATFTKLVTGMPAVPLISITPPVSPNVSKRPSSSALESRPQGSPFSSDPIPTSKDKSHGSEPAPRRSLKRALSQSLRCATTIMRSQNLTRDHSMPTSDVSSSLSNKEAAPPGGRSGSRSSQDAVDFRTAGHPSTYTTLEGDTWDGTMIRERISVRGVIRPLEPKEALSVFDVKAETIGRLSEHTLRRYLGSQGMFEKKFSRAITKVEEERRRNLKLATKDTHKSIAVVQQSRSASNGSEGKSSKSVTDLSANWAWILDDGETPPPSSIVARRDTSEARRLARIADQAAFQDEQVLSGNRFWAAIYNYLMAVPQGEGRQPSKLSRFFRSDPDAI